MLHTDALRETPFVLAADERRLHTGLYGRAARGELFRVRHGVYAGAEWWTGLKPHERYHQRVAAAGLVFTDAIFMRESAAVLHELPIFGEPRDIHIFDPDRRSTKRYGDVVVHAAQGARNVAAIGSVFVTDLLATVVDTARHLPPAYALAVADAALRRGMPREQLRAWSSDDANRRNERLLRWVWDFADSRAESAGESVSRAVISWLGFAVPVLQQVFTYEGITDRSGFWWPKVRAIGESDGYGKYVALTAQAAVEGVVKDKVREDRLRRYSDGFARWDWSDAHRVVPIERKLLRAGVSLVAARDNAMLATLRR